MKKLFAIVLLLALLPAQLFAWGPKGHATIGDVAESRLTPQARANVRLLLGADSLASVASWPDQVRKERDESYDWHFVDIPKDAAGFSRERDCFRPQDKHKDALTDHHNCVVDRIEMFTRVLTDANASRTERAEALKWIVHFVGDIHQPLHAVEEARGGNDIKLPVFGSPQCGDYPCNLHWVWDSILLEHAGLNQEEYSVRVELVIGLEQLEGKAGGTPEDWANESHLQARKILNDKPAAIDEAYYKANVGLVDEKVALAGLRLAKWLNDSLGKIPTSQLENDLKAHGGVAEMQASPNSPPQASVSKPPQALPSEILPTGMSITPSAARGTILLPLNPDMPGRPEFTADHPIATALSPDGNTLLVLTSGFNRISDIKAKAAPEFSNEYVFVYDVRQNPPVKRQVLQAPNTHMGVAWAPDGKHFYVAGGADDNVHVFELITRIKSSTQQEPFWAESLPPIALGHKYGLGINDEETSKDGKNKPVAAGLAVSTDGTRLVVANNMNDSVSVIDLAAKKVVAELDLRPGKSDAAKKGVAGGEYPYGVVLKGNDRVYVSSLRDREIVLLDLHAAPAVVGRIKTRGQPGKMLLNKEQTVLFAVADNSDSVVLVDTTKDRIVAEIKTAAPAGMLAAMKGVDSKTMGKGANPTGLALSPDEKTLYVSNGGTNSVAVIRLDRDLDDSQVVGLVPTGWYPNAVSVSADGRFLYVANAKSPAGPNPRGCRNEYSTAAEHHCALEQQYVWQLEKGSLQVIPRPSQVELAELTAQVAANNHFAPNPADTARSEKLFAFLRTKIRHVIYIVKENRSYDQVLGDLEKGNGDPKLNLFPEAMAPNHHELARRFVTLDNFYDSGEVSGNGWNWSTAARATDFVERTIPLNYAKRGVGYDVEGVNRGINLGASKAENRIRGKVDDPDDLLPGTADVGAPDGPEDEAGAGYLWDSALRAGLSVRNYGFFANLAHYSATTDGGPPVPLLHDPHVSGTRVAFPTKQALESITDPYFRSFDMRFADYWRFKEWEREFDAYAQQDKLPRLELLRLPHDHFGNFKEAQDGVNTVETQIADNDYAIGMVAEKIAHSKYAGSTLIFIIEDDAQNGPDHVDAHRSIAYVIGPYVKRSAVVSEHYTTVSVLRTIEEILGIKALGLYDALQPPMTDVFSEKQAEWSYTARVPAVLRTTQLPLPPEKAGAKAADSGLGHDAEYWAAKTQGFDFSVEDRLDTEAFNRVLWEGLKGVEQPYPGEPGGEDLRKNRRELLLKGNTAPRK
jgi:DNA-binding beta-propeller fold protein YncE